MKRKKNIWERKCEEEEGGIRKGEVKWGCKTMKRMKRGGQRGK